MYQYLEKKPHNISENELNASEDQAVCTVFAYVDTFILRQVDEYSEVSQLFDALQQQFH